MDNLYHINYEEYLEKVNDRVIDATLDENTLFIWNKFLIRQRRYTYVELEDLIDTAIAKEGIKINNSIYSQIDNFRLPILNDELPKSIRCPFTSSDIDAKNLKDKIKESETIPRHKIYLVNPRLYRYFVNGTITLAHVENLDHKYYEGKTDYSISCINEYMIEETGEPLFYLI